MASCTERRFDAAKDSFDVVVTWASHVSRSSNLADYDIVFTLRSFVKYGMMTWVRKIFVVYDDYFDSPPPWFVEGPVLKLISWSSVVRADDLNHNLTSLARIPELSEFFLLVSKSFSIWTLIDVEGKVIVRDCANGARLFVTARPYCPVVLRKSVLGAIPHECSFVDDSLVGDHLDSHTGLFGSAEHYWTKLYISTSSLFADLHESSYIWISMVEVANR